MSSTLIVLLVVIIGWYIFRKIARFISRIILFFALIGLGIGVLYVFGMPPFEKNVVSVEYLSERYCEVEKPDTLICECVVSIIKIASNTEHNQKNERIKMALDLKNRLFQNKHQILSCYAANGMEKVSWEEILKGVLKGKNDFSEI